MQCYYGSGRGYHLAYAVYEGQMAQQKNALPRLNLAILASEGNENEINTKLRGTLKKWLSEGAITL